MEYSILKEDTPQNTIKKIKHILNKLKIEVNEIYFPNEATKNKNSSIKPPTVSLRLEMINPPIGGVNGKGTSFENATASAYAEFMERLQNFILFDSPWLVEYAPDRYYLKNENYEFENNTLNQFFKNKLNAPIQAHYNNFKNYTFLPFYNIKDKKIYNLPYDIIMFSQGSNGMSAGNTIEEATVQSLSEICERYAIKTIFKKQLSIPDIPQEEYIKYKNIKNLIKFYKKKGYTTHIKDASLGGKIPVICSIFEKNGIYTFVFGAHPSLPIAIERTLTEFAQNNNLDEHLLTIQNLPFYSKVKYENSQSEHIIRSIFYTRVSFEKNEFIENCLSNKNKHYEYSPKAWITNNKEITNKTALAFIIKKINIISKDIFIRNVSFLGFPSIYTFIPNMSEITEWNKDNYEHLINFQNWLEYKNRKKNPETYNINTLLKLAEHFMSLHIYWSQCNNLFNAPLEYIAFLCSIVLKDSKKIKKYYEILLAQNKIYDEYTDEQLLMFEIINEYFCLKNIHQDKKTIEEELLKKYKKLDIKENIKIAEKLTFKTILSVSLNTQKSRKLSKKRIENRILKEYRKNCPNQKNLEQHFEKYAR